MPALPTLTVTDTQANRMIAAFGSAEAYRAWLKEQIIAFVIESEERAEYEQWAATRRAKNDQARTDLT